MQAGVAATAEEAVDVSKRAVIALGGNAFTAEGETGEYRTQAQHADEMASMIVEMLGDGWDIAIVHGNGPQVGNLAIQQENGAELVPAQPLFSLVAMTQGELGSLIAGAVHRASGGRRAVAPVVTHVLVDRNDAAFAAPTKPIGPFLAEDDARRLAAQRNWIVRNDAGRGFRRVVASPVPTGIVEIDAIRALIAAGEVVVAAGGGGIPVILDEAGQLTCVNAVIDKDYAAVTLAAAIDAQAVVMVTAVDEVQLDFGTDRQRPVFEMDAHEAEAYLADGQFPEGSMGPKVRAACRFVGGGGERAIITSPAQAARALRAGPGDTTAGTRIVARGAGSGPGTAAAASAAGVVPHAVRERRSA